MTEEEKLKATEFVLKNEMSRRFVWLLLERSALYTTPFTGNSETFHRIGRQDMGRDLLRLMEAVDPTAYPKLMLEMYEHHQKTRETNAHITE